MEIKMACPWCGRTPDSKDFQYDARAEDDLGVVEYYQCHDCEKPWDAELRYMKVTKGEE